MPRPASRKKARALRALQPPNPVKVRMRERKRARKAAEPVKMMVFHTTSDELVTGAENIFR